MPIHDLCISATVQTSSSTPYLHPSLALAYIETQWPKTQPRALILGHGTAAAWLALVKLLALSILPPPTTTRATVPPSRNHRLKSTLPSPSTTVLPAYAAATPPRPPHAPHSPPVDAARPPPRNFPIRITTTSSRWRQIIPISCASPAVCMPRRSRAPAPSGPPTWRPVTRILASLGHIARSPDRLGVPQGTKVVDAQAT